MILSGRVPRVSVLRAMFCLLSSSVLNCIAPEMLGKRVCRNQFFQIFWGRAPRIPARRFLEITHSFKVTRKRLKCLENAFPAINFQNFLGKTRRPPPVGFALWRSRANFNPVLSGKPARAPKSILPRTPMNAIAMQLPKRDQQTNCFTIRYEVLF